MVEYLYAGIVTFCHERALVLSLGCPADRSSHRELGIVDMDSRKVSPRMRRGPH
jgi:hypothetical protein